MRSGLLFALVLVAGCKAHHAALEPRTAVVRSVTLEYPSGLRVLFEQHPGSGRVAFAALVGVGSTSDPIGREGAAHFVEHLAFRSRPSGRLSMWEELDYAGVASAGGSTANGATSYESTTYSGITPKDRAAAVLPLFASMVVQPLLGVDAPTFELERSVVRNEHLERDPHGGGKIIAAVASSIFGGGTPLTRPVGGTLQSIDAITRADLEQFVTSYYRPEATTVVIVGDLEPEKIDAMVRASFPPGWLNAGPQGPVPPLQLDRKQLEQLYKPAPMPEMPVVVQVPARERVLIFSWLAPGTTDPGGSAMPMVANAMEDEFKRVGRAWGVKEITTHLLPGPVRSILMMWATIEDDANLDEANIAIRKHKVFGQFSLKDWNDSSLSRFYEEQNLQRHAENRARFIFATGSTRPPTPVDEEAGRAFAYFRDNMLTWPMARRVLVEPAFKLTLDLNPLPPKLDEPPRRVMVPPEMVRAVALAPPLPEVKRFTLENGLQVVLSRRTPVPLVTVTLALPAGSLHTTRPVSRFIGGLLEWKREGILEAKLAAPALQAVGNPVVEMRPDVTLLRLNHAAWNLPLLLDLLGHNLRPSVRFAREWTLEELDELVEEELKKQRKMEEPRSGWHPPDFTPLLTQVMAPRSSLFEVGLEEARSLSQADFTKFVDFAFRPNGAVLVIDGELDLANTERLVRDLFSDWQPSKTPLPPLRLLGDVPTKRQEKPDVLPGPNLITEVRLACRLPPLKSAEQRGGYALLEEALQLSFEEDLRRARGLTYGVMAMATDYRNEDNALTLTATLDSRGDQEALSHFVNRLRELEGAVWDEQVIDVARWRVAKRYMGIATSPSVSRLLARELALGASFEDTVALPLELASTPIKYVDEAWAACTETMALEVAGETFSIKDVLFPREEVPPHSGLGKRAP